MKLNWNADAEEVEGRKQENRLKRGKGNGVLMRKTEREKQGDRIRERGGSGRVSMGIRNGKFFSFSQLG